MKLDTKDEIIKLLKEECGLKGQLLNSLVDSTGFEEFLRSNNKVELFQDYIQTINEIHDKVMKLTSKNN